MKRKLPQWLLDATNNNDKSAKTTDRESHINNATETTFQHSSNVQSDKDANNGTTIISVVPLANLLSPSYGGIRNETHTFNEQKKDDKLPSTRPSSVETVIKEERMDPIESNILSPSNRGIRNETHTFNEQKKDDELPSTRPSSVETVIKEEKMDPIESNSSSSNVTNDRQDIVKKEILDEPTDTATSNVTTPSLTPAIVPKVEDVKPERGSCNYGIKCFRRNTAHRTELAHPGDDDYRRPNFPTAPIGTPLCPWGAACYRRNPQHFIQLSHPPASVYNPTAGAGTVTVNTVPQRTQTNPSQRRNRNGDGRNNRMVVDDDDDDGSDAGNDYDLDDPFIDNGSSDEYVPEADKSDDDDDLEDTQELTEN